MSILTIAQNIADVVGFERPSFVISSTNPIAVQLLALIKEETVSLSKSFEWQALKVRGTFNFVNGQEAYTLPADYDYLIPKTMWNYSSRRPIIVPINGEDYEIQKNYLITSGIDKMAYILGNNMLITPVPGSTDTINYEYMSLNFYKSSLGIGKAAITADTDTITIREYLVELGAKIRFLNAKGIEHEEEKIDYIRQIERAKKQDGLQQKQISMNSGGVAYWTAAYTQDSNFPAS